MLRNLNASAGGRRILGTPHVGLLAEQIAAETASGSDGPGLLYNEAVAPENSGKRLRLRVSSWPATGALIVAENGAYEWSGLPDGTHVLAYEVFADGVSQGATSLSVSVGSSASAPGAALSVVASLAAGEATGGAAAGPSSADAPGAVLSVAASIAAGGASAAPAGVATLSPADIAAIAAAVVAALGGANIHVDVRRVNGVALTGTGAPGDPMRPA